MKPILLLCIGTVLPSSIIALGETSSSNSSLRSCPPCPFDCEHYEPSTLDSLPIFKDSNKENTIFCLSQHVVNWEFHADGVRTNYLRMAVIIS